MTLTWQDPYPVYAQHPQHACFAHNCPPPHMYIITTWYFWWTEQFVLNQKMGKGPGWTGTTGRSPGTPHREVHFCRWQSAIFQVCRNLYLYTSCSMEVQCTMKVCIHHHHSTKHWKNITHPLPLALLLVLHIHNNTDGNKLALCTQLYWPEVSYMFTK